MEQPNPREGDLDEASEMIVAQMQSRRAAKIDLLPALEQHGAIMPSALTHWSGLRTMAVIDCQALQVEQPRWVIRST